MNKLTFFADPGRLSERCVLTIEGRFLPTAIRELWLISRKMPTQCSLRGPMGSVMRMEIHWDITNWHCNEATVALQRGNATRIGLRFVLTETIIETMLLRMPSMSFGSPSLKQTSHTPIILCKSSSIPLFDFSSEISAPNPLKYRRNSCACVTYEKLSYRMGETVKETFLGYGERVNHWMMWKGDGSQTERTD